MGQPFSLADVQVIEGEVDSNELEQAVALQRAINAGQWSLQGSYGRTMMAAIEDGRCMLGVTPSKDYWGSRIPSRTEVQEGTKGSRQFVVDQQGEAWAAAVEAA